MVTREILEQQEYERLSPYAAKAAESRGRAVPEEKCPMRTDFQRDRDRIIHSKSLRRLMHKTQVFLAPEGDHFRTRLTHTLEVAQIARTIARGLDLNEDLTEAIAMGHDLGHTPFGHNGERYLAEKHPGGFAHNVQSLRIVDVIEVNYRGRTMNLTAEVRDGIVNHTGPNKPWTLEGQIVRFSDRIAYINHDIDDAIRGGIIKQEDLPEDCVYYLGHDHGTRIDTLVKDIIVNSDGRNEIIQSEEAGRYMNQLRSYMFQAVYNSKVVKAESEMEKIRNLIFRLYDYYLAHPDLLPDELARLIEKDGVEEVVKDHVAGMTDRYAINDFTRIFVPTGWTGVPEKF
ncbi:MAG: deoxyguanosinetriphosphate triphosphohydrolase [Firmicutes bacterium]|nr:deoxyguanosinetriphosphate triphosphohydrolase [Bacillota bacterium]